MLEVLYMFACVSEARMRTSATASWVVGQRNERPCSRRVERVHSPIQALHWYCLPWRITSSDHLSSLFLGANIRLVEG